MAKRNGRAHGEPPARGGRGRSALLLEREHITELEVVFELYCGLWDSTDALPRHDALLFVLDELARCGVSDDLRAVLSELRELPFIESAMGPAGDRDSTWFGLQIMLNHLLRAGKRLLSPESLPHAIVRPAADLLHGGLPGGYGP